MTVTININGLSLCHKGSGGFIKNTLPDICKTPSKCIPVPYQIVSFSRDLVKGTSTVEADGGNMCAVFGSEFSKCTGDEAGRCGGIISGTNLKEATWITYSPDVFMEGKPVCRLTDKMWMNHGNTVALGGLLQGAVLDYPSLLGELQILCDMMCAHRNLPGNRQMAIARELWAVDDALGGSSPLKAEVPFFDNEPIMSRKEPTRATRNFFRRGHRRPDVVITNGGPPTQDNIRALVEMKFQGDVWGKGQREAYEEIAGDKHLIEMNEGKECVCEEKENATEPVPVLDRIKDLAEDQVLEGGPSMLEKVGWGVAGVALGAAAVAAALIPFDGPVGETVLGGAALGAFANAF